MYIFFCFAWVYSPIFVTFVDDNMTYMAKNRWIWRRLNSQGYGVQSPNDFYFVQHVLREKAPYYAYATLEETARSVGDGMPSYPEEVDRLLFRVANHVHPATIVELGAGTSAFALAMACPTAQCVAVTASEACAKAMDERDAHRRVEVKKGDEMALFEQQLAKWGGVGMVHVAHTPHYREAVLETLAYADDRTVMVIGGLRESKEKLAWWNRLRDDSMTGTCYDLGNVGIVFLDRSRYKQVYWINIRK